MTETSPTDPEPARHPDPPTGRRAMRPATAAVLALFLFVAVAGIARFLLLPL
jgi:hypothetical protein